MGNETMVQQKSKGRHTEAICIVHVTRHLRSKDFDRPKTTTAKSKAYSPNSRYVRRN